MSGVYQNWLKVQNPNMSNNIVPMESGGFQPPFFFGGSQIPINLGIDNSIKGEGIHGYRKTVFKQEKKGKGIQETEFKKSDNIHIPRHFKML